MKLVSFSVDDGQIRPGSLDEKNVVLDLSDEFLDALAVITAGLDSIDVQSNRPTYPLDKVRLHAPLSNPPRIFAIGLNYRDHAIESKLAIPTAPVVFFKLQT